MISRREWLALSLGAGASLALPPGLLRALHEHDVRFLIGNDEHGSKMEKSAAAEGVTPQEYVDRMDAVYRATYERLLVRWDEFIRTSEPRHHAGVRAIIPIESNQNIRYWLFSWSQV